MMAILLVYLCAMQGSVSEKDASRLLRDACRGLEYMHSHGIWYALCVVPIKNAWLITQIVTFLSVCPSHRDLKPENVLLSNQTPDADIKIAVMSVSCTSDKGICNGSERFCFLVLLRVVGRTLD